VKRTRVFVVALLVACACSAAGVGPRDAGDATGSIDAATVDHVVDGDTAWFVLSGGAKEKVRFIGVDTPETTIRHDPYGEEASAYTRGVLTKGRAVWLELDVDHRDRYQRLLAYIWLVEPATGTPDEARAGMLNAMLLSQGWGRLLTVPPNVAYVSLFVELQREARTARRGLWAA
jgi:micrococcal nuclease